jgi:uncharacterized protein (TIGR02118 family)
MVKLTLLFGYPDGPEAFEAYYANQHLPVKIPNVQRSESGRVSAMDGGEPPYHRITHLWFESSERMVEALSLPEGEAATVDLSNFTTGGVLFVSEVEA